MAGLKPPTPLSFSLSVCLSVSPFAHVSISPISGKEYARLDNLNIYAPLMLPSQASERGFCTLFLAAHNTGPQPQT